MRFRFKFNSAKDESSEDPKFRMDLIAFPATLRMRKESSDFKLSRYRSWFPCKSKISKYLKLSNPSIRRILNIDPKEYFITLLSENF